MDYFEWWDNLSEEEKIVFINSDPWELAQAAYEAGQEDGLIEAYINIAEERDQL